MIARGQADEFAALIEQRFGHQPEEHRRLDLSALLEERLRRTGSQDWSEYRNLLSRSLDEWETLAPLLTVAETYFFRMPDHFEALAQDALPQVLERHRDRRTLRLLSAGCSTGEEPYTLRIVLNERFPELRSWRVDIVGVDLSQAALDRARAGLYSPWSLRATSDTRKRANFVAEGKSFRLNSQARAGVEFRCENLLAPPPANELPFDVIFCRNVLIYFSAAAIHEAIARLTERLAPDGFLFLGPAESLRGFSAGFDLCHSHETFFYRRKAEGEGSETASRRLQLRTLDSRTGATPVATSGQGGSWFSAIQSSSERLAALVPLEPPPPTVRKRPASAPRRLAQTGIQTGAPGSPHGFAALVKSERFEEALALLDAASAFAPGEGEDLSLLRGSMLTNLGRYREAEAECLRVLERDQANPGAYYLLGLCREQSGRIEDASDHMSRSIDLDPDFAMAQLHRGLLARRRKEPAAAQAALQLALKAIDREDPERLALFAGGLSREGLRALCLRELGRLGAA